MVGDSPATPHQTGDNTDFPRPLRQSEARLRNGVRASPGVTARRTRGVLVVRAAPVFSSLVRHRGGLAVSLHSSRLTLSSEGRSHHSDPWREGHPAGNVADAGDSEAEAAEKQTSAHPLATTGTWRTVVSTPDVRRVEPHGCQLAGGLVPSRSVAVPLSTHPFVTVRSSCDGLDPDEVGGAYNFRRSARSARWASPGRRMDSTP